MLGYTVLPIVLLEKGTGFQRKRNMRTTLQRGKRKNGRYFISVCS